MNNSISRLWFTLGLLLSIFGLLSFGAVADDQAGVAAAVRGTAEYQKKTGGDKLPLKGGEKIYLGDHISTGEKSGMQLILMDEAVYTIASNTNMVVDRFVYDPSRQDEGITTNVTKGAFRFVTGKVAQRNPGKMRFNVPTGTIGVRGTMGFISVSDDNETMVINLGPGAAKGSSLDKQGIIEVEGSGGRVVLTAVGFASKIMPDGKALGPVPIPFEQMSTLIASLSVSPTDDSFEDGEKINSAQLEREGGLGLLASERQAEDDALSDLNLNFMSNLSTDLLQQLSRDLAVQQFEELNRLCGIRGDCVTR